MKKKKRRGKVRRMKEKVSGCRERKARERMLRCVATERGEAECEEEERKRKWMKERKEK